MVSIYHLLTESIGLTFTRSGYIGLHMAIDRAVLLPKEYQKEDAELSAMRSRSYYREDDYIPHANGDGYGASSSQSSDAGKHEHPGTD